MKELEQAIFNLRRDLIALYLYAKYGDEGWDWCAEYEQKHST